MAGSEGVAVLRSVLTSLGQLRLLHPGLIDAICGWLESAGEVGEREAAALVVTLANLDYRPPR